MSKLNNFFITLTSIYYKYYKIDEKELFDRYSYATSGDEYGRNSKDTILSQERTLLLGYGGLICMRESDMSLTEEISAIPVSYI